MKFVSVEGNTQWLDGGSMFGNVPKALWEKWIPSDTRNRIHLACRALLVQTDKGQNILFEAGIGAFFEPKLKERYGVIDSQHLLLKNLLIEGLKEEDIDAVVLSHLHFDHAGGLLSAYGEGPQRLLFPRARYYVSARHWERARNPHIRERTSFIPALHALLEQSGRLVLLDKPEHPDLDFGVHFRFSDGHTVGLMLAQIGTGANRITFASDLIPGLPWLHLPVTMGYDRYPELLVNEKKELLEEVLNQQLFFTHDPQVSLVQVTKDSSNKYVGTPIEVS